MRRWVVIVTCLLIGAAAALAYALMTPDSYTSTVRMYATSGTSDMSEAYQGSQAAQASIRSFGVLATDPAVAQLALDKSGVDISLNDFLDSIAASVPPQTVILDVSVTQDSPASAQSLARALATEVASVVDKLQQPTGGGPSAIKLVVVDPSIQGAVRQPLFDPLVLSIGCIAGLLVGIVLALLLERRRPNQSTESAVVSVPAESEPVTPAVEEFAYDTLDSTRR
jgi:capsular polysaccharide biosynthesis protein